MEPAPAPPEYSAITALRLHWPEYVIEGALLGLFMLSACAFTVLFEHPSSPVRAHLGDARLRRALIGLAMAATAVLLIESRIGKRSGAHMNPALTLTFLGLGKIALWDALFYVAAQFVGGWLGVWMSSRALGSLLSHPNVAFAKTTPGIAGSLAAFGAEATISGILMGVVLAMSNHPRHHRLTPWAAGALNALYNTDEAPFSGMSMNPARTLGSALGAGDFHGLWLYFLAPPLGMWLGARAYLALSARPQVFCAKLQHSGAHSCIFLCRYRELLTSARPPRGPLLKDELHGSQ
jgi:aquaporin Z